MQCFEIRVRINVKISSITSWQINYYLQIYLLNHPLVLPSWRSLTTTRMPFPYGNFVFLHRDQFSTDTIWGLKYHHVYQTINNSVRNIVVTTTYPFFACRKNKEGEKSNYLYKMVLSLSHHHDGQRHPGTKISAFNKIVMASVFCLMVCSFVNMFRFEQTTGQYKLQIQSTISTLLGAPSEYEHGNKTAPLSDVDRPTTPDPVPSASSKPAPMDATPPPDTGP